MKKTVKKVAKKEKWGVVYIGSGTTLDMLDQLCKDHTTDRRGMIQVLVAQATPDPERTKVELSFSTNGMDSDLLARLRRIGAQVPGGLPACCRELIVLAMGCVFDETDFLDFQNLDTQFRAALKNLLRTEETLMSNITQLARRNAWREERISQLRQTMAGNPKQLTRLLSAGSIEATA
jgi:hypothetical protein